MFSGGITSWAAGKRTVERYGADNLYLLFADVRNEDEDLYRFLKAAAPNVGGTLVVLTEGRDVWEVFFDERFLGNHRIDPCSRILKREMLDGWLKANCDPDDTLVTMGFNWLEEARLKRMQRYGGWNRWAPLQEKPYLDNDQIIAWLRREGIEPPRLYEMGFQHNNCGGACVKAGQAAWRHLYRNIPERFKEWEDNEQRFREFIGKDVSILDERKGGVRKTLTLKAFRERLENTGQYELDWGSCGCFQVAE